MSLFTRYSIGIVLTFILLVIFLLFSIPIINSVLNHRTLTADLFFYNRISLWLVLVLVLLYNFLIENRSFFVWEDKKYSSSLYFISIISLYFICLFGGAFINIIIQYFTQENFSKKIVEFKTVFKDNYPLIFFTCITAAVVEELLMRAYIQPRLEKIYNNSLIGILGSAFLFGILHSTYGTIGQIVIPFFIGIIFSLFYKKYSNIKVLIICHFLIDFISIMTMNFIDFKHLSLINL